MSPPLSTQAHNYFSANNAKDWSIRDYFNLNASTLKEPGGFESLVRTWTRSLTSFATDSKSSTSKRNIAKQLLENYKKKGDDFREARMMRAILTSMPTAQPPIVVHGDNAFSNATIVSGDNAFANGSVNGAPVVPLSAATLIQSTPTVPQTRQPTLKRKRKTPQNTSSPPLPLPPGGDSTMSSVPTDKKWHLPSGVCVEDTLYECFKGDNEESAAHSWVVDIKDKNIKACFTPEDWQVICDAMPPPPAPDKTMAQSMCRYMGVSFGASPSSYLAGLLTVQIKTADRLRDYLDNNSPFEPNEAIAITPDQCCGRRWADGV
ncbi:uncharacterized protein H6S33_001446 [Morchella sextelata]|uniref:uncharacterized protein n=1 Tax=Morchella sextelata TaxID=1174677 RepID=UPI001D037614|nr:uncharacterized protein H6S33_001446 [Morchella sextelata]KAH0609218.1 hypothetical protein H6S33_001446 [Morchella sextelata]